MNVLVLKVSRRKAVVMADNGEFMTIPAKGGMKEGAAFEYTPQVKTWKRHAAAIAASIVLCVLGAGALGTFSISGYIDININPGVRLAVNQWGKVISAEAINEDGRVLINEINSQLMQDPETSVKQIIDRAQEDGALEASGHILLTISDNDVQRAQRTEKKLMVTAFETAEEAGLSVDITLQKLDMESFKALRKQQEALDDKSKSGVYDSGLWRSGTGLFIEKSEYAGNGVIEVEFSGEVSLTGKEIITVEDLNGELYPVQIKEAGGETLLLQCEGLRGSSIYKVTFVNAGTTENTLTSLLFINALGTESQNNPYYENPGDNGNGDDTSYDEDNNGEDTETESPDTGEGEDDNDNGDGGGKSDGEDRDDNGEDDEAAEDDDHDADDSEDEDNRENDDSGEDDDDRDSEDNGEEDRDNDD